MSNISSALVNVSRYRFLPRSYSSLQAASTEIFTRFYGRFTNRLDGLGYTTQGSGFLNEQGQHLGGASFVHTVGGLTIDTGINSKWLVLALKDDLSVLCVLGVQLVVHGNTINVVGSRATPTRLSLHSENVLIGVVVHDSLADALIEDGIMFA